MAKNNKKINKDTELELNPVINKKNNVLSKEDMYELSKSLNDSTIIRDNTNSESDINSFFRAIVEHLNSPDNISMKTEYLNTTENLVGAKLELIGDYCNVPIIKKFLNIFEIKRVSLERKGRKELVMVMERKEEEIRNQQLNSQNQMQRDFGMR